jgi:hypothetical protein
MFPPEYHLAFSKVLGANPLLWNILEFDAWILDRGWDFSLFASKIHVFSAPDYQGLKSLEQLVDGSCLNLVCEVGAIGRVTSLLFGDPESVEPALPEEVNLRHEIAILQRQIAILTKENETLKANQAQVICPKCASFHVPSEGSPVTSAKLLIAEGSLASFNHDVGFTTEEGTKVHPSCAKVN